MLKNIMAIKTGFFIFRIYLYFLFPSYLTKRVISLKAMKTFFKQCFPCNEVWPDVGIFGHQGGHLQVEQRRIGQFEDLSDGSDGATQPVCVLSLSTYRHTLQKTLDLQQVLNIIPSQEERLVSRLTVESFLKRNLNCSASFIIRSAPSFLSSAFLNEMRFCMIAFRYSTTTRRWASLVISCLTHTSEKQLRVIVLNNVTRLDSFCEWKEWTQHVCSIYRYVIVQHSPLIWWKKCKFSIITNTTNDQFSVQTWL